jgi:alanine racemase
MNNTEHMLTSLPKAQASHPSPTTLSYENSGALEKELPNFVSKHLENLKPKSLLFAKILAAAKDHFKTHAYKNIWVGIDRSALVHNVKALRALEPEKKFCAVLKADAYGHGVDIVAPTLEHFVDSFGITENLEAQTILEHTSLSKPIMRVRLADPFEIGEAMANNLTIEELVGNLDQAQRISELSQSLNQPKHPIHLALNCANMGRDGFNTDEDSWPELVKQVQAIKQLPGVKVVGICGHLPVSDDPDYGVSKKSAEKFIATAITLKEMIDQEVDIHLFASAGTQRAHELPEHLLQHITLNRAGGALFGHKSYATETHSNLQHVMSVCTFVTGLFHRPDGASVGYGSHYRVQNEEGELHAHVPGGWAILPREALLANKENQGQSPLVITNETGGQHQILGNPSMNSVICKAEARGGTHLLREMEPVFIVTGSQEQGEPTSAFSKPSADTQATRSTTTTTASPTALSQITPSDSSALYEETKADSPQDTNTIADLLGSTGARVTVHIGTAKNVAKMGFN